jgi:tRNA nucleotidyltransferase (CCA-adding enzyme)
MYYRDDPYANYPIDMDPSDLLPDNSGIERLETMIPKNVKDILTTLEKNHYEAYVVGGCVRDAILGKEPHDWDITTSATPEEVHKCFNNKHIIDTGLQHGTVTVMAGHGEDRDGYEITTFRIDGDYSDGRHPDSVKFTKDIKEDLARRDFTINAMAYNPRMGLIDPFGGYKDLTEGEHPVIRCVGKAEDRFKEDSLRILRGIRFMAKLEASVSEETVNAMMNPDITGNLETVSQERKTSELLKMLESDKPYIGYELLFKKLPRVNLRYPRIIDHAIPGKGDIHEVFRGNPIKMSSIERIPEEDRKTLTKDPAIRLALFLIDTDIWPTELSEVLKDMKLSNNMVKDTVNAYAFFEDNYDVDWNSLYIPSLPRLKKLAGNIGIDTVKTYLNTEHLIAKTCDPKLDLDVTKAIKAFEEAVINKEPMSIKDLAISGTAVKDMVSELSDTGIILNKLCDEVLDNPNLNNEEYLLSRTKELAESLEAEREEIDRD